MQTIEFDNQTLSPSKVVCIGRNYVDHVKELNNEVPDSPVIFIKPNSAISASLYAGADEALHYEGEIALLIQQGRFAGVGFGLDLTKRTLQAELKAKGLPWERAKAFDHAAVLSPFVPLDVPLESLHLSLEINGQPVQQGGVELMMFKPDFLLQEIGKTFTLEDGDVVLTGTPNGVGSFQAGDRFVGTINSGTRRLVSHTWIAETP